MIRYTKLGHWVRACVLCVISVTWEIFFHSYFNTQTVKRREIKNKSANRPSRKNASIGGDHINICWFENLRQYLFMVHSFRRVRACSVEGWSHNTLHPSADLSCKTFTSRTHIDQYPFANYSNIHRPKSIRHETTWNDSIYGRREGFQEREGSSLMVEGSYRSDFYKTARRKDHTRIVRKVATSSLQSQSSTLTL